MLYIKYILVVIMIVKQKKKSKSEMKYTKSPYSQYLKKLKALYPDNSSPRWTYGVVNDRLTHREFKMVLPFIPKQHVAMKGSQEKPSMI